MFKPISSHATLISLVLLGFFGMFVLAPLPVHACSCVGGITREQAFSSAEAVFTGEVVKVGSASAPSPFPSRLVEFRADRAWKGVRSGLVMVSTGFGGGDCGYDFAEGQKYLVYANEGGGMYGGGLHTGICNRTALASDAAEDIAAMGVDAGYVLAPPSPVEALAVHAYALPGAPVAIVVLGFLSGIVLGVLLHRKARPRKRLAVLLVAGPLLANAAFFGLGSTFAYPQVLQRSPMDIFMLFGAKQGVIMTWFAVLALGAGLLAPISILLRGVGVSRRVMWIGIAAAIVQVIGLSRWVLIVPNLMARGDEETFRVVHAVLGTIIGESVGYLLTGLWTLLLIRDLRGAEMRGRWLPYVGIASAALILTGLLIPFGVPGTSFANFIGYVLWSVWMIAFGIRVWRAPSMARANH